MTENNTTDIFSPKTTDFSIQYLDSSIKKGLAFSETFITYGLGKTKITFETNQNEMNITFDFKEDQDLQEPTKEIETFDDGIYLTLINYNNPLGTFPDEPFKIAETDEDQPREIYLTYIVRSLQESHCKEVCLSIYGDVSNG